MPWLENDQGVRLWYEDQGHGPPLVLLHGWCMSSKIWHMQMEQLSSTHRVLAPDLAGHGASGYAAGGGRRERFAADLVALFDRLDLQGALLVGWSMGAQVALAAVERLRHRLAGLALIAATPCFTASESFPHGLSRQEADGMALKVRRNIARALEGFTARMFAPGELEDPTLAQQVGRILSDVAIPQPEVALESLASLADADLRPVLPGVDLPVLILNGDRDLICLPEASDYLADRLPASQHHLLAGCGHAPFLTRPDEFNRRIGSFFRGIRGACRT